MKPITLFLTLLSLTALAQTPLKREFRGAWIATVSNIDYPSSKTLTPEQQRNEFINLLNQHQQAGLNAVVVQIRSNGDALYQSSLEPWSEVLTGKQGQAPNPIYDPLTFMVAETHKRGMEFHAWFNPYRAVPNITTTQLADNHIAKKRPDILLAYGNLRILDPGHPESRNWVTKVVMDVVRRYDIDAVHFDDYFYPYPTTGLTLNDDSTYVKYNRGIANRADWRRDNIDLLIKMVSDSIKSAKPYVKFGISPFGIWQNKSTAQPNGSDTRGLESYNEIYANSTKWTQQGWVDYMAPQLYWYIGFSVANYAVLLDWWAKNANNRHLYIGQGAYRINADANWNAAEMPKQIRLNRTNTQVQGSIYYNTNTLNKNPLGFRDSLRNNFYRYPALQPAMSWKKSTIPSAPTNLTAVLSTNGIQVKWTKSQTSSNEIDKIRSYVIYRFKDDEKVDLTNAKAIRTIIHDDSAEYLDIENPPSALKFTYVVTALDRLHNESNPSNEAKITVISANEEEIAQTELFQNYPNPTDGKTIIPYFLAKNSLVKIKIYDWLGREIRSIIDEQQTAGKHEVEVNNLTKGLYIYTLEADSKLFSKRMIVE
jgi:uncharacterized lipoprotein YddW (UPF0748 family)